MNKILTITVAVFLIVSCNSKNHDKSIIKIENSNSKLIWPDSLPVYDHIVIVVEENKDYTEVIDADLAPYINKYLRAEGASFTNMYGEEHHSQGNYFWFFSGSNQDVGFNDIVPNEDNNKNYPFTAPNIASQLIDSGYTFSGYSESLPYIGCDTIRTFNIIERNGKMDTIGLYGRKHVPWISFANVPDSLNKRFLDFPKDTADFKNLPTVSFVIPNLNNDMHNGPDSVSISIGDSWLKKNMDAYYQWSKNNNSLLIITFDENDDFRHIKGLTDPDRNHICPDSLLAEDMDPKIKKDTLANDYENKVVTIFAGAHIKQGEYSEGKGITHVTILRTIEAMYGLPKAGKQQINAANYGISDDDIITDVFQVISNRKPK